MVLDPSKTSTPSVVSSGASSAYRTDSGAVDGSSVTATRRARSSAELAGEPDGAKSDRALALSKALSAAGLKAPVRPRLRDEIWVKLWGNLSFNPISALTHATLDVLCTDPGTRAVARGMMLEAQEVAEKLGVKFPIDVERRIDGGAAVGAHRTSMLQDLDAGRPMEIEALVGSVRELAEITGVATPTIDTVLALIRLRAKMAAE